MWYRIILAYREIKDPKGEKSIHKHKIEGGYHSPTFVMKPGDQDISQMLGTGSKAFGPGHYTSQNKIVAYGYDYPFIREEKFPMGTRILDFDKIDENHGKRILDALNQKYDKNIELSFPTDMYIICSRLGLEYSQVYPILVELGYDAIEYDAGRNFSLDHIVQDLKKDPKKLNPKRKNLDKDLTSFEKPKSLNRRIKKIKQEFDKKNVLVINANILTNPRLFQKERFRPETLSEEEKETLEKGKFVSSLDVTVKVIEYMKKTDPNWEKQLRSFSCEAILNLLVAGVIDNSFPFGRIYNSRFDGDKALEFLAKGVNPVIVIEYTKNITFDNFVNIKDFLVQNDKEYLIPKLDNKLSYKDVDTVVQILQNNFNDLSNVKTKFLNEINQNWQKITISDLEKLISVGFKGDDFKYLALQHMPEDVQRLLKIGFDKKHLVNWFAVRNNLDFSKTGFTVQDIIENYDIKSDSAYVNLMISLSKRDIDVKPLWENYKHNFLIHKDHLSYNQREGYALNIYEALKNTDVPYKEIIDTFIKPTEQGTFAKMNMHNDDLQKPENAELLKSVEKYELVRNALFNLEKNLLGSNTLVCDNCGYILQDQRCPKCLGYGNRLMKELYQYLEYFDEIVNIYSQMPESRDLLNSLIYVIDSEINGTVDYLIFAKADIFEFINSYLKEFLDNEKYLAAFNSLKRLKYKIDIKEIVPSPVNNAEDYGTITLGDPEDED
jgi:hypothetical protein